MKRILALSFAFAALTISATAQQRREMKSAKHPMHQGQHNKGMMMKEMNFTPAQKSTLKANHQEYKTKMQDLSKNENISVKDQRDRKKALRQEQKSKMEALLTPEQKNKLTGIKATKQAQKAEMRGQKMAQLKTKLGLSNDQASRLKSQNEATHSQLQAIKENQSLTRADKKQQMKAIKDAAKIQRKEILTQEQMKKMEELKKEGRNKDRQRTK